MAFGLGLAGLMGGVQGLGLGMSDMAQRQYETNQFNQRLAIAQQEQNRLDREEAAREAERYVSGDQIRALSGMLGVTPPEGTQFPDRLQANVMPAVLNRWGELQKEAQQRKVALATANALDPQELGPANPVVGGNIQAGMTAPDPVTQRIAQVLRAGGQVSPQDVQMWAALAQRQNTLARNRAVAEEVLAQAPKVTDPTATPEPSIASGFNVPLAQMVDPKAKMLATLLQGSDQPPDVDALMKALYPERAKDQGPIKLGPTESLVTPQGQVLVPGGPPEAKNFQDTVTTADGLYRVTYNQAGQEVMRVRIGDAPAKEVQQGAAYVAAVDEYLRNPTPQNKAKVDLLKPQIVGPGALVSGPTNQGLVNPAAPAPGERQSIAQLDYISGAVGSLLDRAADPEIKSIIGSVATNPLGRAARAGEEHLGLPLMTDNQRGFLADKGIVLAEARKIMFGVRQTAPELAALAPALPSDNDPGFIPKLAAWKTWADANRDAINGVLSGVQIKVPPRPGGGGGTGAGTGAWGKAKIVQ
jgi:hypothetical protein